MAELFPLADLRDPPVLLKGARVPLVVPAAALESKHEWCADHYYQRNAYGKPFAFKAEDMVMEAVHIDLSNEDTARWVDRKIASLLSRHRFTWATLYIDDGIWMIAWGHAHVIGICGVHHLIPESITPTEANIPAARAALLRALFGRENT